MIDNDGFEKKKESFCRILDLHYLCIIITYY